MNKFRIIPKLEIKSENVVKGIRMEGLRIVGQPVEMSASYINLDADELIYIDTVASLYNRNQLSELVSHTSQNCTIPVLVGGGLRNIKDLKEMFRTGADKVSINTGAHTNINLIYEAAKEFGSQSIVGSVQAKRRDPTQWEAFYLNGRENSKKDVFEWCRKLCDNGVGEILLTSVDNDGTRHGLDRALIEKVLATVDVPVIVSGGTGNFEDIEWAARSGASGIAIGHLLHFRKTDITAIKDGLSRCGIGVRRSNFFGVQD